MHNLRGKAPDGLILYLHHVSIVCQFSLVTITMRNAVHLNDYSIFYTPVQPRGQLYDMPVHAATVQLSMTPNNHRIPVPSHMTPPAIMFCAIL